MKRFSGIVAILIKEFIQVSRDRLTFGIIIGMPIIQLILFGFSINSDPRHLPLGVVIKEHSVFSRNILKGLENSTYFDVVSVFEDDKEASVALEKGTLSFVLTINSGFERKLLKGEHPQLLLEADATDPGTVGGALGNLSTIVAESTKFDLPQQMSSMSDKTESLIDVVVHRLYNPEGITAYNIIPGLIGTILSMTMIMITSMALTRERERGTMENLLAMPLSPLDIMIGKILPYIMIGLLQFGLILVAGHLLFRVPLQGSLCLATVMVLTFITANLIIGYLFSTLAKTQLQAMQLTFFFFLPSMLLSGFMFPFYGMPVWAQYLSEIFPITHFLRIIRGILLKGSGLEVLYPEMLAIIGFIIGVGAIALGRFRRTLD
jgi:ABC-2 type transport system permease protein